MFAIGTNLDQFDKVGCGLHSRIILPNSGKRIGHHDFRKSVQVRSSRRNDRDFRFKKEIQLSRKWRFGAPGAFGDGLNAAPRFRAPGDNQAGVTEFPFSQQDAGGGFHIPNLADARPSR
jgi:hypothetical protein